MAQVRQARIPDNVIYSIHEDSVPVCQSKKNGKKNIHVSHFFRHGSWNVSSSAYYQGYAPASYQTFLPYIPGMTLEMVLNGGPSHQAHAALRHLADHYHSGAWHDFALKVNSGSHGVFVGSKYKKDLKRSIDFFDLPVESLLTDFTKEAQHAIIEAWNAVSCERADTDPLAYPFPTSPDRIFFRKQGTWSQRTFPTRREIMMKRLLDAVFDVLPLDGVG